MDTELASITLSYVVAPTPANRRALCGVYLAEEPPPNDFLIGLAPAHKLPSLHGKGTPSMFHLRAVRGSAQRRPARAWPSFEGLSRSAHGLSLLSGRRRLWPPGARPLISTGAHSLANDSDRAVPGLLLRIRLMGNSAG